MDIREDTVRYEAWLRTMCRVNDEAIAFKHREMSKSDSFPFFRGTYYRWARLWRELAPQFADAPRVLAIGDIHLENYGTWRDGDGRLCWGINDFDEASELPYAHDLVRLAASTRFARKSGTLEMKIGPAAEILLAGYQDCLAAGGQPFVLEEHHPHLRAVALDADEDPRTFWLKHADAMILQPPASAPEDACAALIGALPKNAAVPEYRERMQAGVGSLGKPRYVAIVNWNGGWICREAKAVTPPPTAWLDGSGESRAREAVEKSIRSHDPCYQPGSDWLVRRLAPHCSRIELKRLRTTDVARMLDAMGREIANVHLGTPGVAAAILADLKHRPKDWLENTAKRLAGAVEADWRKWCENPLP